MSGDPGLFGPHSVTWRIHGDPSMAPAGLRALLLQAVHPLAMAGVAAASSFREDPWGRLFRTAEYVATVSYGTTADAERHAARVRGLHRRAGSGIEPESGQPFRVDDPDLLRWVHVTEVESFLSTYRRCGGPLEPGEADAYLTEQRRAAALVGVDPETVPGDEESLAAYFDDIRPQLRVTKEARRAAQFILLPPMPRKVGLATPAKPAWAGMAGLAFAMLPAWARRLYRLPGLPTTDLGASLSGRALRTALLAVPAQLREGPALREARARVAG
jgi:uncharacterized protein (DUF2236 family)